MDSAVSDRVTVEELTDEEAREVFDARCQRELGVSGEQFLTTYKAGALPPQWSAEAVSRVEMLLPLTR